MSLPGPAGYSTREVSDVLGLAPSTVLAWARDGLLSPRRDPRGAYVFSFQDVALLRSARDLLAASVPPRRLRRALEALRAQLPAGRPLSAVRLTAMGRRVLVDEGGEHWTPETGQIELALAGGHGGGAERTDGAALPRREPGDRRRGATDGGDPDAWYDRALDLEGRDPSAAAAAYRRALELDPTHAEAHLNLGRLLHEGGDLDGAEERYRSALAADPRLARAAFNLGVVLEDRGLPAEAEAAYGRALELDDALGEAHFNLSRLREAAGDPTRALAHLAAYKRILDRRRGTSPT